MFIWRFVCSSAQNSTLQQSFFLHQISSQKKRKTSEKRKTVKRNSDIHLASPAIIFSNSLSSDTGSPISTVKILFHILAAGILLQLQSCWDSHLTYENIKEGISRSDNDFLLSKTVGETPGIALNCILTKQVRSTHKMHKELEEGTFTLRITFVSLRVTLCIFTECYSWTKSAHLLDTWV